MRKLKCFFGAVGTAWGDSVFKTWTYASVLSVVFGTLFRLPLSEVAILIAVACIGLGAEMVNASMESLMDIVHPSYSPAVKVVKDAFGAAPSFIFSGFIVAFLMFTWQAWTV